MLRYAAAKARLAELGYPSGKGKWKAFWAGHRAKCMGDSEASCPYTKLTPAELAAGKRPAMRRTSWLAGYRASAGIR